VEDDIQGREFELSKLHPVSHHQIVGGAEGLPVEVLLRCVVEYFLIISGRAVFRASIRGLLSLSGYFHECLEAKAELSANRLNFVHFAADRQFVGVVEDILQVFQCHYGLQGFSKGCGGDRARPPLETGGHGVY